MRILYQLSHKSCPELQNLALFSSYSGEKSMTEFYVRKTYTMVSRKHEALPLLHILVPFASETCEA